MRGGYIHNRVLIDSIAGKASQLGANVETEVPIGIGNQTYYGDILIQHGSKRILVEAELSSKRVMHDLKKSAILQAELWIVVPNPKIAKSVRRKFILESISPKTSGIFIFCFPQALQRLEEISELNSQANIEQGK